MPETTSPHALANLASLPASVRGALYMAVAALAMVLMHALVRVLSTDIHPFEIAFFRNFFGFLVLLPVLWRQGTGQLRARRPGLIVLRGFVDSLAMLAFFAALAITPLAAVTALSFTAPLFATLLAIPILREVVGLRRALSLVVGFVGALIVVRPGSAEIMSAGAGLVLLAAGFWGLTLTFIKILSRTESSVAITFYAALALMPLTLLASLPVWTWPDANHWGLLALTGVFGTVAQLCLSQALRLAEVTAVLPIDFTRLIWSALLGFVLFAEIPDAATLLGGSLIFGSVVYITHRERLRSRAARDNTATTTRPLGGPR
ncbi:MAG: DMT family transporter [Pseudomonadota bacterium]